MEILIKVNSKTLLKRDMGNIDRVMDRSLLVIDKITNLQGFEMKL